VELVWARQKLRDFARNFKPTIRQARLAQNCGFCNGCSDGKAIDNRQIGNFLHNLGRVFTPAWAAACNRTLAAGMAHSRSAFGISLPHGCQRSRHNFASSAMLKTFSSTRP